MLPAAYSRAQVHHRHRGRSAAAATVCCAREETPGITFLYPALTCRPFFFVPPAYRARFFKATHVLSMCDMPFKRHEAERDTRVRCMRVSTFSRCHILMHTRGILAERMRKRKRKRKRAKRICKNSLFTCEFSKNMETTFP